MPTSPPVHQPVGVQSWAERKAAHEAARPSPSRIYGWQWQKLRRSYLAANPLCECGCLRPAQVVHHRQGTEGELMYDWDNLQALTKPCHDKITAAESGGFGNPIRSRQPQIRSA